MATRVYQEGVNIVVDDGIKIPRFIPLRAGRVQPHDNNYQIHDWETRESLYVEFSDLRNKNGDPFPDMVSATIYLADFIGSFKVAGTGGGNPANTVYDITALNRTELITNNPTGDFVGQLAFVEQAQGNSFWPGPLGGTYYPEGLYLWTGSIWTNDDKSVNAQVYQNIQDLTALNLLLSQEITNRTNADNLLQNNIDAEALTRQTVDEDTVNVHSDFGVDFTNALDGDEIVIINNEAFLKPRPIIIEKSGYQRSDNDFDTPILDPFDPNTNVAVITTENFTELGLWKPKISFLAAVNSTGANFEASCTFNGNSIVKSNPISAIVTAQEFKDSGGSNPDFPGNVTGAGTDNLKPVTLKCSTIDVTQASNEIILLFGCETDEIIASIAEITIEFERVYNVKTI